MARVGTFADAFSPLMPDSPYNSAHG